jgi:uncharacterized membrane protein YhaH (DUF805 family)
MKESIHWFMTALKKYAVFEGRAQRKEYWYFVLIYLLTLIPLGIVDFLTGTMNDEIGIGFLGGVYMLLMLCPTLAVTARRLHDIGQSGWWQLLNLVPLLGFVIILYFTIQDSQPADNQYGPKPVNQKAPL